MPAKSKAQQRLMAAAEHGASFPMAEKLRSSMTHQQLHDFASGSQKGKPEHVRKLHPALAAHGAKVKAAHAALGLKGRMGSSHMKAIQAHIRRGK